jgi:sulfate permease, SulP family
MPFAPPRWTQDLRAGLETALQGLSTSIGPILILVGLLGSDAMGAGYWAALVSASVLPLVRLGLGGHTGLLPAPRAASLTTYATLVYQLCVASAGNDPSGLTHGVSPDQLRLGLAAGVVLYFVASTLVLLAGVFRLGHIFKMIPSPVSAGIGNGTALLLAWLALQQLHNAPGSAGLTASVMLGSYLLWQWLQRDRAWARSIPAVAMAVVAGGGLAWLAPSAPLPALSALSVDPAQWIPVLHGSDLSLADLQRNLRIMLPGTLTLALIMILESFTAAGLMENRFNLRTDGNRELIALGGANMLGALVGGVPCTTSPLFSVAFRHAGGRRMASVLFTFALVLGALLMATPWLIALPVGIGAGLLLLQCGPLVDPVFRTQLWGLVRRRAAPLTDLGFQIAAVISLIGFFGDLIWACLIGIGLSSLAVLKRVSTQLTAQWTYLDSSRSRRMRTPEELAILEQQSRSVGVLQLTGHLFFGNSVRLQQLAVELDPGAHWVALDIGQVYEADPSGVAAVRNLVLALQDDGRSVHLSGLTGTASPALRAGLNQLDGVAYFTDLDRSLERCETLLLTRAGVVNDMPTQPVAQNQLLRGLTDDEVLSVLSLGELRTVAQGATLFDRGAQANGVWLLTSGQVSVLWDAQQDAARLATLGPGQFVGEMGLIDGQTRSACARADAPTTALLLDRHAIATLVELHPPAALQITRNIAKELSLRLRNSSTRTQ